jgi:hypothetical protein
MYYNFGRIHAVDPEMDAVANMDIKAVFGSDAVAKQMRFHRVLRIRDRNDQEPLWRMTKKQHKIPSQTASFEPASAGFLFVLRLRLTLAVWRNLHQSETVEPMLRAGVGPVLRQR